MNEFINKILLGDALKLLESLPKNSIDLVLTDPPYFLDKMDNNWDPRKISAKSNHYAVKSLPAGMKFDREQGKRIYKWYIKVSENLVIEVMKKHVFSVIPFYPVVQYIE